MLRISIGIMIGSMIPAAWMGEMANDMSGTASNANPPNPPFEIPVMSTAIIAMVTNQGSANSSGIRRLVE